MPFLPFKGEDMEKHKVGDVVEINGITRIITAVNADSFVSTIYDPPVVTKKKVEEAPKEKKTTTRKRG